MDSPTILWIGGAKSKKIIEGIAKRYTVNQFTSGKQALQSMAENPAQMVILDASSMRSSGVRTCQKLADLPNKPVIIYIHASNTSADPQLSVDIILQQPFTSRKLMNAIKRLSKGKDVELLLCGPFSINTENRILTANEKEIALTPKQTLLLELFFRHPNETLERGWLMKRVWNTDYLGDTRTLDVHIRWIRTAIEPNAKKPQYLKTVRGVGYRLEIPIA